MVRDIIGCLQHKAHELLHIKGVVGKLRMVPKGGMVTLREALERMCETQKHKRQHKSIGVCVYTLTSLLHEEDKDVI